MKKIFRKLWLGLFTAFMLTAMSSVAFAAGKAMPVQNSDLGADTNAETEEYEIEYGTLQKAESLLVFSTKKNGSDLSKEDYAIWKNPMELHNTGFFELTSAESAKMKDLAATVYIPTGSEQGAQCMMIVPDSSVTNYGEFIIESGWKDVADKEKCFITVLHVPEGGWSDYAQAEKNITDYISGISGASAYFLVMNHGMYLSGYGDAASVVQKYAMRYPTKVSGVATFGDVEVTEEYMEEVGNTPYYVSGTNRDVNETVNKEIMMNMFMSVDDIHAAGNAAVADYWKTCNGYTTEETFDNELVADVVVKENSTAEEAAENLFDVARYIGYTLSNMRSYAKAEERGAKKCFAVADVSVGEKTQYMNVEYFVYIPKKLDLNRRGKAPVVMIFHGGTGNGDEFLGRSGYYKIADEQGCIVVSVSKMYAPKEANGDYQKSESSMTAAVLKKVLATTPADPERVYAYGFSGGGQLTFHMMVSEYAEMFAAIAPRSGTPRSNVVQEGYLLDKTSAIYSSPIIDYVVPVWLMAGEYESDYNLDTPRFVAYCEYFRTRNGVADAEAEKQQFNYVDDFAYTNADTYRNQQGFPMFRFSLTSDIGHSIAASEARTAYVDFLKHWTRNTITKDLYYDGKLVITDLEAPEITAKSLGKSGIIQVSWNRVKNAAKYEVYMSTSKKGEYSLVGTTSMSQYTFVSGKNGKKYYFKVKAVSRDGITSEFSNRAGAKCVRFSISKKEMRKKVYELLGQFFTPDELFGSIKF
ncbi:MAG: PHB depolymerase family esterase [Clostridiales bacterium]|nr:PHB depolymerase family esterase [Clostridiales bacterium]